MKKTVITTFAAVAALSAGLVAAKGAHEPSWHTQDHGEIPGLQAVPKNATTAGNWSRPQPKHKPTATTLTFRCAAPKAVDTHRLNQAEGRLEAMRSDGHIDVLYFPIRK